MLRPILVGIYLSTRYTWKSMYNTYTYMCKRRSPPTPRFTSWSGRIIPSQSDCATHTGLAAAVTAY